MRRREFIAGTAATAALGFAQPIWAETNARSTDVKRIAFFYPAEIPPDNRARKAYFAELKRLGYIEGQNLIVERYSALGQPDRIGDARAPDHRKPSRCYYAVLRCAHSRDHGDDHQHSHDRSNL